MADYIDKNGNSLTLEEWREERRTETPVETNIDYNGQNITVCLQYEGHVNGALYSTKISCTSDIIIYYKYRANHDGLVGAQADYDRLVQAVTNGEEVRDIMSHSNDGHYTLMFSPYHDKHLVNDNLSEIVYAYDTRTEAEAKFNELKG